MRRAQDVGGLRHEVHAAEDDVLRLRVLGRPLRELERVAATKSANWMMSSRW